MKIIFFSIIVFILSLNINANADETRDIYNLNPGDEIEISVWKDESLSRQLIVPPDGFISFPLIGDIDANDLSIPELREIITSLGKLTDPVNSP
jgi:polysaccharide export outer membrane protein